MHIRVQESWRGRGAPAQPVVGTAVVVDVGRWSPDVRPPRPVASLSPTPPTLQAFWELPFPPSGWQPGPRVTSHPRAGPSQKALEEWALLGPGRWPASSLEPARHA